jgi:hypothetical protein
MDCDLEDKPPSETRFAIDWATDIASSWNVACRNFFAADFVLHVDQYLDQLVLPTYARDTVRVLQQFDTLLKVIRNQTKHLEQLDDSSDKAAVDRQKLHNEAKLKVSAKFFQVRGLAHVIFRSIMRV